MERTPHPDELARSLTSATHTIQPRDSQITQATVAQRSARRLIADQLGLTSGQRLLVLLSHAEGLAAAQRLIENAAHELGVGLSVLDTRELSLASEAERRVWREALERCQACVLLGGEGRPAAERFEAEVRVQTGGKPLAILRFDPDAILADGLLAPSVLQRAYGRYLASRLSDGALVTVRWHGAPPLVAQVGPVRASSRPRASLADVEYPHGHVAVPLASAAGHLARPTSILAPRGTCELAGAPQRFQFLGGVLRAVSGGEGAAWLGQVSRSFPGMRLRTLGFGLISPSPSAMQRAGVRLSDVGCTFSVVDARLRGVNASSAAHTGLTFCLNGPGLDVDIDGTPILRSGEFVEPTATR